MRAMALAGMTEEEFANVFDYAARRQPRTGEWTPPPPPQNESSGLQGKVPVPMSVQADNYRFTQSFKGLGRQLLQDAGGEVRGAKVPHNWFGQGKYKAPMFEIASGKEECDLCKLMVENGKESVTKSYSSSEGSEAASVEAMGLQPGQRNLCYNVDKKYTEMCKGYIKYLIDCPSFVHNICHEDVGGSERLRSPCPTHLKCYYCLRINPLYC
eukprot:g292.t1